MGAGMSHTPGPWSFELYPDGGFDIETNPDDVGKYMVIASRNSHQKIKQEMHANARLIAAAPELLEAAEKALHYMRLHKYADQAWADDLASAISKARGES